MLERCSCADGDDDVGGGNRILVTTFSWSPSIRLRTAHKSLFKYSTGPTYTFRPFLMK